MADTKAEILQSRFAGCLLGLAVGDALGLVAENLSRRAIRKRFGQLDRYGLFPGRAYVSDDAEQALALAASLAERGRFDAPDFARRLRRWFWTLPPFIGLATVRACFKLSLGFNPARSGVNSAGNGSAMRVPPLGLFFCHRPEELAGAAEESTRVTHTHPRAVAGTVVIAVAVAELAGEQLGDFDAEDLLGRLAETARRYDTPMAEAVARVASLLAADPDEALEALGTSGYVLHTVPTALYCFLRSPGSFRDTVSLAASAGGDTDTIAAIAGALSGAFNGSEGIPQDWLTGLESAPGAGRASYIWAVAARLREAARTGAPQPPVRLGLLSIARARLEFLALLLVHIPLRAIWLLMPRKG